MVEGQNWFDFPYDWRRDNRVAARHLGERAPGWLQAWRKQSGNNDAKLILVAHSIAAGVALWSWPTTAESEIAASLAAAMLTSLPRAVDSLPSAISMPSN